MMNNFDVNFFLPLLAMLTLLGVVIFALVSKRRVEEKRHDPNSEKSTLAKDAPDHR
jgi:hypothetical protein